MSHIVIADDEDDVREFLLRAVRRYAPQAEVTAVVNGAAALEMISQRGCDLLISDHRMPVMTGVELLQAVRESQPILPVVIISADMTAEIAAAEAGVTAFFYKPLTIIQIRQIIETWLPPMSQLSPHTVPSG
jgi:two-component system response regulator PilR (NtrC family)